MSSEIAGGPLSNGFKQIHTRFNIQQAESLQWVTSVS